MSRSTSFLRAILGFGRAAEDCAAPRADAINAVSGHAASSGATRCAEASTSWILDAESYYDVLGLGRGCTVDEVKTAYRSLAKSVHPDLHPDDPLAHAKFVRVQEAYDTLSDAAKRPAYDARATNLGRTAAYWNVKVQVTFSMSYYGYEIPLDTMDKAAKEAARVAGGTGGAYAEIYSQLLLDPLIAMTESELQRRPNDLDLLLQLADLNFHTYRSYRALPVYLRILSAAPGWLTGVRCNHIGQAFFYAGEYWGGVATIGQLLNDMPSFDALRRDRRTFEALSAHGGGMPADVVFDTVRRQWQSQGLRVLKAVERQTTDGLEPGPALELAVSFLEKRREFGRDPDFRDFKRLADLAIAAQDAESSLTYLELARAAMRAWSLPERSSLIRAYASAGLYDLAVAVGEEYVTPELLTRTLGDEPKRVCRALAEAYERIGRYDAALAIYSKLSRYKDASATLKKKADALKIKVEELRSPHPKALQ